MLPHTPCLGLQVCALIPGRKSSSVSTLFKCAPFAGSSSFDLTQMVRKQLQKSTTKKKTSTGISQEENYKRSIDAWSNMLATNHQRNANWSHAETPPLPCQNSYWNNERNWVLATTGKKKDLSHWWRDRESVNHCPKLNEDTSKVKMEHAYDPTIPLTRCLSKENEVSTLERENCMPRSLQL